MTLKLQSREFEFRNGQVWLIPTDWEKTARTTGRTPAMLQLQQGEVKDASVEGPGDFQLLLANLSIARFSDKRTFFVPLFLAPALIRIGEAEIMNGTTVVSIQSDGLFCVTLFDPHERKPLAHGKLKLSVDTSTFTVHADENGDVVFLNMPTSYRIQLGADMGMTIVPI